MTSNEPQPAEPRSEHERLNVLLAQTERLAKEAAEVKLRAQAIETAIIDALNEQIDRWKRFVTLLIIMVLVLLIMTIINNYLLRSVREQEKGVAEIIEFIKAVRPILCRNYEFMC